MILGIVLTLLACSDFLGSGAGDPRLDLVSATPGAGSVEVSVLSRVSLRFTADLDSLSAVEGVRLETAGRTVPVGYALLDARTLSLTPIGPLDFGTEYDVVLTRNLVSSTGTPLASPRSWSFRTVGSPPPYPSGDSLRLHLGALAHDSMRGRGSGSVDELRAARYLEDHFRAYGLRTPPGGMIQPFRSVSRRGDTLLSSRNVLAALPGTGGLADQWLIVGAHYDHIGFRNLVDESLGPNNGADDNASGTVLVLELARLLRGYVDGGGMGASARRSVLFMAFGAEEEGLLGSCHYAFREPVVPLSATRAMVNLDMVGRLRQALIVSGQETSAIWPVLLADANASELPLLAPEHSAPTGSDHTCFWQAGIPWLGFFTQTHAQYHRPTDDVELINFQGLEAIGELGLRILTRLMVMPEGPEFVGPIPAITFTP